MGTHMWTNGASRRGRRMSLDLPPLPITPKDSEFLQRRPDLFYPYLPAPFLNGVQQKVSGCGILKLIESFPRLSIVFNFIFISFILFSSAVRSFANLRGLIEDEIDPCKENCTQLLSNFDSRWNCNLMTKQEEASILQILRYRDFDNELQNWIIYFYLLYIRWYIFFSFFFKVNTVYDDSKYAFFKVMSVYLLISDPIFKPI